MDTKHSGMSRRNFIATSATALAGILLANTVPAYAFKKGLQRKQRVALVGTGIRGITFWGKRLVDQYSDILEFVGLCDINPGRLAYGKEYIGAACPTFTDFDEMMDTTQPDLLIVTTVDATHDYFITRGMEKGADVLTEKPMTTDEKKCQNILDTERKTGKKLIVGFNYRYSPHFTRIKELLANKRTGRLTSVDFHWYLNTYHGASYFRRWHGERQSSGTLLVHKATHHFDLLNWFIDSEPYEVYAYGDLEHYGINNSFRGNKCRTCPHTDKCEFYWDITRNDTYMKLYVENEQHDGYIRDNCLWRHEIDIYDKMAVQIKYANNVQVSYSLTTYSPYEGWRIAFNGFDGRLDSWEGIPWRAQEKLDQAELHAREMSQNERKEAARYNEIMVMDNFGDHELIKVPYGGGGHGGGDRRLQDRIFKDTEMPDPLNHAAGSRDGAMSILIGVAARKSIEQRRPVKITELTSLKPSVKRPVS